MTDTLDRRIVTFAQAEGSEELPNQLKPKELSRALRAFLWKVLFDSISKSLTWTRNISPPTYYITLHWEIILKDWWVDRMYQFSDEFNDELDYWRPRLKEVIGEGEYVHVFDFLQFCIRHRLCPDDFVEELQSALEKGSAAYRISDKTIFPVSDEVSGKAIVATFQSLERSGLDGARSHLRSAAEVLTTGDWPSAVRESIHAVESALKVVEPSEGMLSKALKKYEKSGVINPNLKRAMNALYDYTSDEEGIRHAKVLEGTRVDEAERMYMFGACSAFLTFVSIRELETQ